MAGIEEQNAMDVWMYTIRTGKISYSVLLKSLQWLGNNARSGMEYQGTHGHISEAGMKKLVEMRTREHINTSIHVEEELTAEQLQSYETAFAKSGVAFHRHFDPEKGKWELQFEILAANAERVEKACRRAAARMEHYQPSLSERIRLAQKHLEAETSTAANRTMDRFRNKEKELVR